jgi:hypothetical protein
VPAGHNWRQPRTRGRASSRPRDRTIDRPSLRRRGHGAVKTGILSERGQVAVGHPPGPRELMTGLPRCLTRGQLEQENGACVRHGPLLNCRRPLLSCRRPSDHKSVVVRPLLLPSAVGAQHLSMRWNP